MQLYFVYFSKNFSIIFHVHNKISGKDGFIVCNPIEDSIKMMLLILKWSNYQESKQKKGKLKQEKPVYLLTSNKKDDSTNNKPKETKKSLIDSFINKSTK